MMRVQGPIRQQPRSLMATQRTVCCSEPTCQEKISLIPECPFYILFHFPQSQHYEGKKQFRNGQGSMELFQSEISSENGLYCLSSNFMTSCCCFLCVIYIHNLCAVLLPKLVFLTSKIIYPAPKTQGLLLVFTLENH